MTLYVSFGNIVLSGRGKATHQKIMFYDSSLKVGKFTDTDKNRWPLRAGPGHWRKEVGSDC